MFSATISIFYNNFISLAIYIYFLNYINIKLSYTTADSVWRSSLASQEELQEVIQLLSVRPQQSTQLHNPSLQLPGIYLILEFFQSI